MASPVLVLSLGMNISIYIYSEYRNIEITAHET